MRNSVGFLILLSLFLPMAAAHSWFEPGGDERPSSPPPTALPLDRPQALLFSPDGPVFIADTFNHCVRTASGSTLNNLSDYAGVCGEEGRSEIGEEAQPGAMVRLSHPAALAYGHGVLYVLDSGNGRLLKVGRGTGHPVSVVSLTPETEGLSVEIKGALGLSLLDLKWIFIADTPRHRVLRVALRDGTTQIVAGTGTAGYDPTVRDARASRLDTPTDLAARLNDSGDPLIFIADSRNNLIRLVQPGETVPWRIQNWAGSENPEMTPRETEAGQAFEFHRPYRISLGYSDFSGYFLRILESVFPRIVLIDGQRRALPTDLPCLNPGALAFGDGSWQVLDSQGELWNQTRLVEER